MFEKLHFKSKFLTAAVLYAASFIVRLLAFLRVYILSHRYGANTITDKYLFALTVMEILAYILASNHAISLLMRYYSGFKEKRERKRAFSFIFQLYAYLTLLITLAALLIMVLFFEFTWYDALVVGIASYFFVMSIVIQSILNFLELYESVAYQDVLGHTILVLGVLSGKVSLLFLSLVLYGISRFLFLFIYLFRKRIVKLNLSITKVISRHLLVSSILSEIFWLIGAFAVSSVAIFIRNYKIKELGIGYFSAADYAQRLLTAITAFIILPIMPMFTNFLIKLKGRLKKGFNVDLKRFLPWIFLFNIASFILIGILYFIAPFLLRIVYFHGAFTQHAFFVTLRFFKVFLITVWTFNVTSIIIQFLLVFTHAKHVFFSYLISSFSFVFPLFIFPDIFTGLFVAYLVSFMVFLGYVGYLFIIFIR